MRERTPSGDDTLVRAPPTPSTPASPPIPPTLTTSSETASAKVIVVPGLLEGITIAPVASVNGNNNKKMVASSHSLEELGVTHPASASGDRGGAQETNRTAQTALDKRSRLSNVINNLRKKVPEAQPQHHHHHHNHNHNHHQHQQQQQEKEEGIEEGEEQQQEQKKIENDGRNSVERNLENLQKYVMTVLNDVIKDEAAKSEENNVKDRLILSPVKEEETSSTPKVDIEASFPENQGSKVEGEEWRSVVPIISGSEGAKGAEKNADEALEGAKNVDEDVTWTSEICGTLLQGLQEVEEEAKNEEKADIEMKSLEKNSDDNLPTGKEISTDETASEDVAKSQNKLMDVCRELMTDLINDVKNLIEVRSWDSEAPELRLSPGTTGTSLHCSLPLDKVAPILRSCNNENHISTSSGSGSPQRSPSRPSPPTIRHLCLYCDRKFLSISLRQRHAERVHQVGGGSRRSERNSRRSIQSCQYCSERLNGEFNEGSESSESHFENLDNLDSLFRHMAKIHPDRYFACVQCSTRYSTRENLLNHTTDVHGPLSISSQDNIIPKESSKEQQRSSPRDTTAVQVESKQEDENVTKKEAVNNPASPEFDSAFYSSVSCNIRENLLHHLDGKLQSNAERILPNVNNIDNKIQQQNYYETNSLSQIQLLPIDISLTAATPVYTNSKEYSVNDGNFRSSEYAQRPGKTRTHPRRVSFEKYNFPRKYDGKEPWSCSIKDLSKFDISTQLTLSKKQQITKALINNRICGGGKSHSNEQITNPAGTSKNLIRHENQNNGGMTDIISIVTSSSNGENDNLINVHDALGTAANVPTEELSPNSPRCSDLNIDNNESNKDTIFSNEFANFIKLKKWGNDVVANDRFNQHEIVYAELTGEWSRPRIYVCGACAERYVTMKEMEEHKSSAHPNVWCSHFEFAGDQRDLYKHLFLPGKGPPTAKARAAVSPEKICTKCSKNCNTLAELHRHMLECGGDQTWLLGLFGNGKKKCKWRAFGSRSRRRRQRGMKRNIQNSQQTGTRSNIPKERHNNGPRVRPSDRESIQKMLANLPPKRASRKVMREENLARSRDAAQTVQTRSRPRISTGVSSSTVQSRNKTVLKNKLLKNAKSFQRNRTRIDNITAAIESVVSRRIEQSNNETRTTESRRNNEAITTRTNRIGGKNLLSVLSKKKNVKTKDSTIANIEHPRTRGRPFGGVRVSNRSKVRGKSSSVNLNGRNTSKGSGRQVNTANSKNNQQQQSGDKNTKHIEESELNEEKCSKSNTAKNKKKKIVDPVASLNASIKAKSQLRTNDGKFARNPEKRNIQESKINTDPRYPRRRINAVEFIPKLGIKATKDFGKNQNAGKSTGKKIVRTISEGDKMPTLEPAVLTKSGESPVAGESDKIGRGNELPVLSPVAVTAERKTPRNNTIKVTEKDEFRKNISEDHLDLDDVLEKSVIDVAEIKNKLNRENSIQRKFGADKKCNRGSRGKRITLGIAPPTPATSSASSSSSYSSSSSSSSSSCSPSTRIKERSSKNQRILPRRRNPVDNEADKLSNVNEKPDLMTRLGFKTEEQKLRRSTRSSLSKDRGDESRTSPDENSKKTQRDKTLELDEDTETPKIGRLRKSPRNLNPKNATKSTKIKDLSLSEKLAEEEPQADTDSENSPLQVHLALDEDLEEEPEEDPGEVNSGLPKRGRGLGKRRGRIKAMEEDSLDTLETKDEEISESVGNLSLEHLQHESSNSNIDSGKENSSDRPVALPKPRTVRPRKTKNGRVGRDRNPKRTLCSVIRILTEGVNIPVEIQQSVVLTVQTSSIASETTTNSENGTKPEDERRNEEITIGEEKNEDGENPEIVQRPEILPGEIAQQKNNPDECETRNPDDSGARIQDVEEAVPLNASEAQEPSVSDGASNSEPAAAGNSNSREKEACVKPQVQIEPSNDIIMDLSRRKPKGKGSFLEKIVSKIAKQKDVLLGEGDVGFLLDNAADELTDILDEVAPNLRESTENLSSGNDKASDNCNAEENSTKVTDDDVEIPLVENEAVSFTDVVEERPASEGEPLIEVKVNEDSTASKKRSFETNSPKKNKRKSVDAEANSEAQDLVAEELCLADIMKLIQNPKTNGEKETETPRPGKRKTANENDGDINEEEIGGLQDCPKSFSVDEADSKRPRRKSTKKKILVEEHLPLLEDEQSSSLIHDITEICQNTEDTPKKINKRKTSDEDPATSDPDTDQSFRPNSVGSRSAKRRSILNVQRNVEDSVSLKTSIQESQRRSSKRKSSIGSDKMENFDEDNSVNSEIEKYNEELGSRAKNIKRLTEDNSNTEESPDGSNNAPESSEKKSVTKKRKSLAGTAKSEGQSSGDDELRIEEAHEESKKLKTSIAADDSPVTKNRRVSKKTTPLVDEHLDLDSDDSSPSIKAEDSVRRDEVESLVIVERVRSLRRRNSKRKSLAEDHLELFSDEEGEEAVIEPFKVPEITDLHYSRTRRSSKRSFTLPEAGSPVGSKPETDGLENGETPEKSSDNKKPPSQPPPKQSTSSKIWVSPDLFEKNPQEAKNPRKSLINEHLNLSDEENEDLVTETSAERNVEVNEPATSTAEVNPTLDIPPEVPKKRGLGNFTVGHTKTGQILIVEKKKKLTKEAAKFFCEVCATSFTRKSSLKKHNSSQSHLMQLAKSEKASETATPRAEDEEEKEESNQDYLVSEESQDPLDSGSIENTTQNDDDKFVSEQESTSFTKNRLTPQISEEEALEDELLDEEICKITENMTHDDFVLTDHISPEPSPVVTVTEKNKIGNKPHMTKPAKKDESPKSKKRNLAEEHLDLDSPSPQQNKNIEEYIIPDFISSPTSLEENHSSDRKIPFDDATELMTSDQHTVEEDPTNPPHSRTDAFCPEELPDTDGIPLPKTCDAPSHVISIPVTIQRDVLIPSDESSSDLPLAEVLNKSLIPRIKNSKGLTSTPVKPPKNIAEELDSAIEKNQSNIAEFESDDNSMDTKISVDISKILNDSEMRVDDYARKLNDGRRERSVSIDQEDEFAGKESSGKRSKKKTVRGNEGAKYSGKKHARKSRSEQPKRRQCHLPGSDSSEDENSDVTATSESRNKNRIVKSVFGRVFGSEKLEKAEKIQDKVKEVLDDWDSRSEDDVRGRDTPLSTSATSSSPGSKRNSRSKKRRNRSKTKTKDDEERAPAAITESRSRRSKKRAEERISKAFEEESTSVLKENSIFQDENDFQVLSDHQKTPDSTGSLKIDENAKIDDEEWAAFSSGIANHDKSTSKESKTTIIHVIPEAKEPIIRIPLPPWPSMLPFSPSRSSPGQSSVARSSVRNRSPTPDQNSQFSGSSDSEDDDPRGKLSPVFVRNMPDTSMDSMNSSYQTSERVATENSKKLSPIISSPILKRLEEDPEVVTIAPNDAVEDNALDVPRPPLPQNTNTSQKPRQAKVLNFDEELFVECCSRLKATSENEFRGAKKIKIDHFDAYHKKDAGNTGSGFRNIRDRWRDVESQKSLGSLLESVNQYVGEERYANNEKDYSKYTARNLRSENSSRSGSPDLEVSRPPDNLGYEDSLEVAFAYNNKIRDTIQQRMKASENLIASSFAYETSTSHRHPHKDQNSQGFHPLPNMPTGESRNTPIATVAITFEEQHETGKNSILESSGMKHKMSPALGGLLDKLALSNFLHNSSRHDHNGSTPRLKVLAELACARAPTKTPSDLNQEIINVVEIKQKESPPRKIRNPIKELFERKKEMNDRNETEKTRAVVVDAVAALKELNNQRQRKTTKKSKKQRAQEYPLVRKSPYGGMAERKKRRDVLFDKKDEDVIQNDKVKDVYDFDDEESQAEVPLPSVVSFRSKTLSVETDLAALASKTIVETLENGKKADVLGRRLESMIDRKFKEMEKSAPKTKAALKAFQNERSNPKDVSEPDSALDKTKESHDTGRETIVGPMDDFVQRKQQQHHRKNNDMNKRSKSKKRSKTSKKKTRATAWYENDSSDEFRTAAKTEDVGVGISKSQRTCSKGKQNLFAELSSTSSESEIEDDSHLEHELKIETENADAGKNIRDELADDNLISEERYEADIEREEQKKKRNYSETKKSESEMSDHPLIIDERRESDEDSNARNNYEPSFEMDDLYREDSSDDADAEYPREDEGPKKDEGNVEDVITGTKFLKDNDDGLIPIEEALDLLDQPEKLNEAIKNDKEFFNGQENKQEVKSSENDQYQDYSENPVEQITPEENELVELPEKLSSNEKPAKASDNLPLHVFLSRKVQESKKRKQQHLKKAQEEQERILLELQPTRRQRKCAIGKQGLLAEISSSDEDSYDGNRKFQDKERSNSPDKPRRQKRESREKRKERYIEKKHEQIIAKEQKAIEEEILRELGKNAPASDTLDKSIDISFDHEENRMNDKASSKKTKRQKPKKNANLDADSSSKAAICSESENNEIVISKSCESPSKQKKQSKSEQKSPKKSLNNRTKKHSECNGKETKEGKDRRSSGMKRDSTDEELRTTKSWNKVEEGVGVAIGRRKRAAANQLYYWSSSSDEEEELIEEPLNNVEEEDDRQEQHGWIVGDSHKKMITMLAMEKKLKEKRRRSEDEFEPNKAKNKKHRNSTS